jgi:hypothetical protein
MLSALLLNDVLPLVALALREDVEPHLLDELDHLQFGLHLAPACQNAADAVGGGEQLEGALPDAAVELAVVEKEHQAVEGRHSLAEFVHLSDLVVVELVEHLQFPEVVHQQGLEVDVELHRVVLAASEGLPIPLNIFLLKHDAGFGLGLRLNLNLLFPFDLVSHFQRRLQFFVLVEGRVVEIGDLLMMEKLLNAAISVGIGDEGADLD